MAAVSKKTPLQMAKTAPEFLAVRVHVTAPPASPVVFTFFLSRNAASFADVQLMKVSAMGASPVSVPYEAVANRHLATTKRNVPDGPLEVVDVAGNFTAMRDASHTSGDAVCAVLSRVESGTRMELRLSFTHARTAGTLVFHGGCVHYEQRCES
jgi:hypothetical protein